MDQLVGRLERMFTADKLNEYDLLTSSYGDNYRLYMRGQLTVHKNNHHINRLWQGCSHLSKFNTRLRDYRHGKYEQWHFMSAEGCYSRVVADTPGIAFLSMANQLSDASGAPPDRKESILVGNALVRCYGTGMLGEAGGVTEHASVQAIDDFLAASSSSSRQQRTSSDLPLGVAEGVGGRAEALKNFYRDRRKSVHERDQPGSLSLAAASKPVALYREENYDCAYWIGRRDQVCLSKVPADVDIMSKDRDITYIPQDGYRCLGGTCREGAISHFQGWKKGYFTHMTRPPPLQASFVIVTQWGFVPFRFPATTTTTSTESGSGGNMRGSHVHSSIKALSALKIHVNTPHHPHPGRGGSSNDNSNEHSPEPGITSHARGYHIPEAPDRQPGRLSYTRSSSTTTTTALGSGDGWVPTFEALMAVSRPYGHLQAPSSVTTGTTPSRKLLFSDHRLGANHEEEGKKTIGIGSTDGSKVNGGRGFATTYCAGFSADLKACVCPLLEADIRVVVVGGASGDANTAAAEHAGVPDVGSIVYDTHNGPHNGPHHRGSQQDSDNKNKDEQGGVPRINLHLSHPDKFLHNSNSKSMRRHHGEAGGIGRGLLSTEEAGGRDGGSAVDGTGTTLVTAGWVEEYLRGEFDLMLSSWAGGRRVLVLARISDDGDSGDDDVDAKVRAHSSNNGDSETTIITVNFGRCASHMNVKAAHTRAPSQPLPDTTLYNIGLDAAATDVVCIAPKGSSFGYIPGTGASGDSAVAAPVRDQLLAAQAVADAEHIRLQTTGPGRPVALVTPEFGSSNLGLRGYPDPATLSPSQGCGAEQAAALRWDYSERRHAVTSAASDVGVFSPVLPFSPLSTAAAQDEHTDSQLMLRHTVQSPVLFNTRACGHGDGFVRLPEELAGTGCYGSTLLRALVGAGYNLRWAGFVAERSGADVDAEATYSGSADSSEDAQTMFTPRGDTYSGSGGSMRKHAVFSSHSCGCVHGESIETPASFVQKLAGYYHRASELRKAGIGEVYSRESFAERYESEQQRLQLKK
jgi:hypothetical protein